MRFVVLSVLFLAISPVAMAQSTDPQKVIAAQLEAFQADDLDRAFGFASPSIQGHFRSAETFGAMVENGYPMVWRPGSVTYLPTRQESRPRLMVTDQQGRLHILEYEMIEGPMGWRINGVRIVPQSGA